MRMPVCRSNHPRAFSVNRIRHVWPSEPVISVTFIQLSHSPHNRCVPVPGQPPCRYCRRDTAGHLSACDTTSTSRSVLAACLPESECGHTYSWDAAERCDDLPTCT